MTRRCGRCTDHAQSAVSLRNELERTRKRLDETRARYARAMSALHWAVCLLTLATVVLIAVAIAWGRR